MKEVILSFLILYAFCLGVSEEVSDVRDGEERKCTSEDDFVCNEEETGVQEQCIDKNKQCNGISECNNGYDESVEVCGCLPNEFQCNATVCIDSILRCDTNSDCLNGSDEINCEAYVCPSSHIKCDNHLCIPREAQCNFVDDCGDNSDEHNCVARGCWHGEFQCKNGQCIAWISLCDGRPDCIDGSDEIGCDQHVRCKSGLYVSRTKACDGWADCKFESDDTDEHNCGNCTRSQYRCRNSRCISKANRCDGICDCKGDCDDEENCNELTCVPGESLVCRKDSRCIGREYICDGENQCFDSVIGTDETNCSKSECDKMDYQNRSGYFQCKDGRCIKNQLKCNLFPDCSDREDELGCNFPVCEPGQFQCLNHQCISQGQRCDGSYDCKDRSDEQNCENVPCPDGKRKCYSGQCVLDSYWCDFHRDCPDGSDEKDCYRAECSKHQFRCDSGQCVNSGVRCYHSTNNSLPGCVDMSHLYNCADWECSDGQFKCLNSACIDKDKECDRKADCPFYPSDENGCPWLCPGYTNACHCLDVLMDCSNKSLEYLPSGPNSQTDYEKLSKLIFSGNRMQLQPDTFKNHTIMIEIDLSYNGLNEIPPNAFNHLWRLSVLNLAFNNISVIRNGTFTGLSGLKTLVLTGNHIKEIQPFAFAGLSRLGALDLQDQGLETIQQNAFYGMRQLHNLILSRNEIEHIDNGAFNGLDSLISLHISENKILAIEKNVFHGLSRLQYLYTDEFRFCCGARDVEHCFPEPDEFSSCEDLMSNYVLRISIWVLGMVASFGNLLVIGWRSRDCKNGKVHSFLIANLAIGDFFMGIYLMIIAVVDAYYRGHYILFDKLWRQSELCKFAGFMSTFSSELSVLTLTVITLDRLICIIFPLKMKRLSLKRAAFVMLGLWQLVFLLSVLPLTGIEYFDNFYGRSGVCLALHITSQRPRGWEYSVFVFLVMNFVSFLIIFLSYLWMFIVARKTQNAVRGPEAKSDNSMARRMTMIVMTDFACWVPIVLLGFASLCGATVPPQVYAWIAVFVLPLNSAINPILYTISTAPFLRNVRRRANIFRKSFIGSLTRTDTKLSYMDDRTSNYWDRKSNYRQMELIRMRNLNSSFSKNHTQVDFR